MSSFNEVLDRYAYDLSPELIAQTPASPRDSAKILVYDRKKREPAFSVFRDIDQYLPLRSLLILNRTKVIPARIPFQRPTGGVIEVLSLGSTEKYLRVLSPKRLQIREMLTVLSGSQQVIVDGTDGNEWLLRPLFPMEELPDVLEKSGTTPLPPYIKHSPLTEAERRREYQSVFARDPGSIAAPTASLHFTRALLTRLKAQGIETASVTLHVHLGTFAPLTEEKWQTGRLHLEEYVIPPRTVAAIKRAKEEGRPVIAVGTTVVRTLESSADDDGTIIKPSGTTDLFIREGHRFRVVDGMITNFHVPRSSLLMLVSAFVGHEVTMDLYRQAAEQKFRFFSFGDAMLLV
jgi:S-adenosylmethionine:tRNA ribosyltransferase-isomerase